MPPSIISSVFRGLIAASALLVACDDADNKTPAASGASSSGKSDTVPECNVETTATGCEANPECRWDADACVLADNGDDGEAEEGAGGEEGGGAEEGGEAEEGGGTEPTCGGTPCVWATEYCVHTYVGDDDGNAEEGWACEPTPPGTDPCTQANACPEGFGLVWCSVEAGATVVECE